jgi:hypothetical protein
VKTLYAVPPISLGSAHAAAGAAPELKRDLPDWSRTAVVAN